MKRLLQSSRAQFGIAAIVTTLVVMFLKWPAVPEGVTDAELIQRVLEIQAELMARTAGCIVLIVGVITGGTSLEDAFGKFLQAKKKDPYA